MNKIFIVAEIGVNHNGDTEMGKHLIDSAAIAGADAVKTQLFDASHMTSISARKADYQIKTTGGGESQLDMLKKLELSTNQYRILADHAKKTGITLFAAPFDINSAEILEELSCPIIKIASGEITNLPLLKKVARTNASKIFISTGMSNISEIKAAINVFKNTSATLTLLHCHTQYPTEFADANLLAMAAMREETGLPVGYSDHTEGTEVAIAAAALGAVVIEKHFTLDRALPGPDHRASLEPDEFAYMVRAIRNVENALGNGIKAPTPAEIENMAIARKSIVAARAICKGETFNDENMVAKRPGNGISPMRWHEVAGKTAMRGFAADEMIEI